MTPAPPRSRLAIATSVLAVLFGLVSADTTSAAGLRQATAVPAYWAPDTAAGAEHFERLAQQAPTNAIVVINGPGSGPPIPFGAAWAGVVAKVHGAGSLALGYVDTGYLGSAAGPAPLASRPDGAGLGGSTTSDWLAQIKRDIDDWYALYGAAGLDGIFFDQTTAACGTAADPDGYASRYAALRRYVTDAHPHATIVINPGVPVDACYAAVADTIITFEGSYATYVRDAQLARPWQLASRQPRKFWHLVYGVPDEAAMRAVVQRSKRANAGYIYVTDNTVHATGTPWDTLPRYWDAELVAAAGVPDHRPPRAPGDLRATTRTGTAAARADLTWTNPPDNVATARYDVFAGPRLVTTTVDNGAALADLAPATTYTFRVRAHDVAGNVGPLSEPLTVATPALGAPIQDAAGCVGSGIATYRAAFADPVTYHRVFIDADNDARTGYAPALAVPGGMDLMLENGTLYRYAGGPGWTWSPVPGTTPLVSDDNEEYRWRIPAGPPPGAEYRQNGAGYRQNVVFQGATDAGATFSLPLTIPLANPLTNPLTNPLAVAPTPRC